MGEGEAEGKIRGRSKKHFIQVVEGRILCSIRFNKCQVLYLQNHNKSILPNNPNIISNTMNSHPNHI
jgi:hypothetical protein